MHDAYGQIDLTASSYGVFMAGPSATGDIEGVIIHGAQGARSMTILLWLRKKQRATMNTNDGCIHWRWLSLLVVHCRWLLFTATREAF